MQGTDVYIRWYLYRAKLTVKCLPNIRKYILWDGALSCIFGCIQASKLWFEKLTKFLWDIGYEHCIIDRCVTHRVIDDDVSNILVIATEEELFDIQKQFKKKFQWMTVELASMHSYLGLQIMIQDGTVEVDMSFS